MLKASIITVCFNSVQTIEDCLKSVADQTYKDIEHVIIDGASTDGTLKIIEKYRDNMAKIVSEPDNGIYDAVNKGLKLATGDIIGTLNSDDFYADETVIQNVVKAIMTNNVDSCYGDLVYVDRNSNDKVVRYWKAGRFYKERFQRGWMPPHPTFFVKKVSMKNMVY